MMPAKEMLTLIPETYCFIRDMARQFKEHDVIVCMSQKSFVFACVAKIFVRKPIIWFMNDILNEESFSPHLIRLVVFLSKRAANHVVVNSQASLAAWLESGGMKENASIIYSGVDVDLFEKSIADKAEIEALRVHYVGTSDVLIGTVGRISSWKGQHVFLQALARIEKAHGLIVGGAQFGEDEYEATLKQQVIDLGLQDRVTFTGHVDNIPQIMAACDIVAHCATSPEPFGRVIVEAMLARTVIIASQAGGPEEIIEAGRSGYLYEIGKAEALSATIEDYLALSDTEKEAVIDAAYARAEENFSARVMIDKFNDIVAGL